jgi:hypothetical protein
VPKENFPAAASGQGLTIQPLVSLVSTSLAWPANPGIQADLLRPISAYSAPTADGKADENRIVGTCKIERRFCAEGMYRHTDLQRR